MGEYTEDHTRRWFLDHNGVVYYYETGHRYEIRCQEVPVTSERPGGLKYALTFFSPEGECLVRFDNSHAVNVRGKANPEAFDHWHRSEGLQELVPYSFIDIETLIIDFFSAMNRYLPEALRT
jgi:Family of unknown function (DUF6516)